MSIYVAEIAGRATFAFDADSEDQAKGYLSDKSFLSDLYVLQSGGRSLWNGKSEIRLGAALPDEAALWDAGDRTADEQASSLSRVFLIPVIDPLKHDNDVVSRVSKFRAGRAAAMPPYQVNSDLSQEIVLLHPFSNVRRLFHGLGHALRQPEVQGVAQLALSLILIATMFYWLVEGLSLLDPAYFAIVTIATVGYGGLAPHTVLGKIFTIGYIVSGIGIFVAAVTALAQATLRADQPPREWDESGSEEEETTRPAYD